MALVLNFKFFNSKIIQYYFVCFTSHQSYSSATTVSVFALGVHLTQNFGNHSYNIEYIS